MGCLLRTLGASMWAERGGMPRTAKWTYVDRRVRALGRTGPLLTRRINRAWISPSGVGTLNQIKNQKRASRSENSHISEGVQGRAGRLVRSFTISAV